MSVNLTNALQNIQSTNINYKGVAGSREVGVCLEDTETVTWAADGYGNIQATAAGGSAPSGSANEVYATPNGSSGAATLRALVSADLPAATNSSPGAVVSNLIETIAVSAPQVGVTFSGIPQNFQNLKITGLFSVPSGGSNLAIKFNGDSGAHYYQNYFYVNLGTPTGGTASAQDLGIAAIGIIGSVEIEIPLYASTPLAALYFNSSFSGTGSNLTGTAGGAWTPNAAVTSIELVDANGADFAAGTSFTLYGY